MKLQTEKGEITISSDVFTNITGAAATNCYGVKGMAMRSKTDGLVHLLRRESMGKRFSPLIRYTSSTLFLPVRNRMVTVSPGFGSMGST